MPETVKLRDVELTRHVRTPAGVARFHKPIGTPLGGKATRSVKKVVGEARPTPMKAAHVTLKAAPVVSAKKRIKMPPEAKNMKAPKAAGEQTVKIAAASPVDEKARWLMAGAKHIPGKQSAELRSRLTSTLNTAKIDAALKTVKDPQKRAALQTMADQRKRALKVVDEEFDKTDMNNPKARNKFFAKLTSIMPALKKRLTKDKVKAIKDKAATRKIIDSTIDALVHNFVITGLLTFASLGGIHLLGI